MKTILTFIVVTVAALVFGKAEISTKFQQTNSMKLTPHWRRLRNHGNQTERFNELHQNRHFKNK